MNTCQRIKFPHSAIIKASGLLPMMYSINELCFELDVSRHFIRSWLQTGMPYERDGRQHIWINGEECAAWIEAKHKAQKRKKILEVDQGFCFNCNNIVTVFVPRIVIENGNRRLTGLCPDCKGPVNKGVSNDQPQQLQASS